MKKKIYLISLVIVILIIIISLILFLNREKKYSNWNDFVNSYKDNVINLNESKTNYTNKIELKDKKVLIDNKTIITNIIKVIDLYYNEDNYIYLISEDGKLYYMNNINMSTLDKYELTELGDYKNIIEIKNNDNKIIGTDINYKNIDMTDKLNNYIAYSKQ